MQTPVEDSHINMAGVFFISSYPLRVKNVVLVALRVFSEKAIKQFVGEHLRIRSQKVTRKGLDSDWALK